MKKCSMFTVVLGSSHFIFILFFVRTGFNFLIEL